MTTPDSRSATAAANERVKRPTPKRTAPDRSGTSSRAATHQDAHDPAKPAAAPHGKNERIFDEAVAASVRTASEVLAETIEQGRRSARSFRHGDYNYRDIPVDVQQMASNMLKLARQLSESTFEICEALLSQRMPGFPPAPGGPQKTPAFRDTVEKGPAGFKSGPAKQHAPAAHHQGLHLAVQIVGAPGATALSSSLSRPRTPTRPSDITAAQLLARDGTALLASVEFDFDLAHGGLIATVTVSAGQPAGVYSGAVFAAGQDYPLGLLVIQLPAAAQQQGA